ncbi:MAG: hypothetical protein HKO62_08535 [Gammaproteobacteria bacterium]|nr:hypothetical protein [Gammaproteobacteria bacterium]
MRRLLIFIVALLLVCVAAWFTVRTIATLRAESAAQALVDEALGDSRPEGDDERVTAITRRVYEQFEPAEAGDSVLLRLRGWLTNSRLPAFVRLPDGVIETLLRKGLCDNAGRMLSFTLRQADYASRQWDMVSPSGGHSAVLVTLPDGREILADPFFGFVAADQAGRLMHPLEARKRARAGQSPGGVLAPLGGDADGRFYADLAGISMAAQGEALRITASLPRTDTQPLFLGAIDGDAGDVSRAAARHAMGPYWHYIGHRYSRQWIRELTAVQRVRLEITLIDEPEAGVLTADPAAALQGKTLSWELNAGDTVRFHDGRARLLLRRLNSYIGVDRIAVVPQD